MTGATLGLDSSEVRGILQEPLNIGAGPIEHFRFCLANFSDYIGAPVRYGPNGGEGFMRGRLEVATQEGKCTIDQIPEAAELIKTARRDAGFVISHVGNWAPASGPMTVTQVQDVTRMLHFWFGLLRGAWSGPLFPQGVANGKTVWRSFAAWKCSESREVPTWLPERTPIELTALFRGFSRRWADPAWQSPLISAISWLVEANSPRTALESRIILAQVALELLSWVHIVETQKLHTRTDFKRLSAAGRIRILLQHIGVTAAVPFYFENLTSLLGGDASDGPGMITRVRNALVHSAEESRVSLQGVKGPQLAECGQLALHYTDLALLAVCEHNGSYARRGWKGWKGDDEVPVPWCTAG